LSISREYTRNELYIHAFGAACTKKLELISKRSMEASLHENFTKCWCRRAVRPATARLRKDGEKCAARGSGAGGAGKEERRTGRQKFLPQTPSFLPSRLKEPPFSGRNYFFF